MSAGRTPRVLFVGRRRTTFPLPPSAERRNAVLSRELDWRQLGTRVGPAPDDPRYALAPEPPIGPLRGAAFHAALPFRVARELRRFAPDAMLVQGAQETALALLGRRLSGRRTPVVLDVHGDWRAPTRLYGSRGRRLLAPVGDALARLALRHADAVRTITPYTSGLVRAAGREPAAEFPAYMDIEAFTASPPVPLPAAPRLLFVGVLELYKAVDVLADAWRLLLDARPAAQLHVVGTGSLTEPVERLVADHPGSVRWERALPSAGVVEALDAATALVLPSRAEGMGRVVVEAFCRARPVIGSDVGGIPDLVHDEVNGLLVPPADARALASAMQRLLDDAALAERLSRGAETSAATWAISAEAWAASLRRLIDTVREADA